MSLMKEEVVSVSYTARSVLVSPMSHIYYVLVVFSSSPTA